MMTKLEQKLIELGYKQYSYNGYNKKFNFGIFIYIAIINNGKIYSWVKESPLYMFDTQQQIDNLQQAFNRMNRDLEILKELENERSV